MPAFNDGFLDLPQRPGKPRTEGLTHVIDKGLNMRDVEGLFDTAGQFVDIVKLGWGTSYITNNLDKKIALYRYFETPIVCGGTLFEVVYARDRLETYGWYSGWVKKDDTWLPTQLRAISRNELRELAAFPSAAGIVAI